MILYLSHAEVQACKKLLGLGLGELWDAPENEGIEELGIAILDRIQVQEVD